MFLLRVVSGAWVVAAVVAAAVPAALAQGVAAPPLLGATVAILGPGGGEPVACGVFVGSDGFALTTAEALARAIPGWAPTTPEDAAPGGSAELVVTDGAGGALRLAATPVVGEAEANLALLRVEHRPAVIARLGAGAPPHAGDEVWALACTSGGVVSVAGRVASGAPAEDDASVLATTDLDLPPAAVGAPVVDAGGGLVGLVDATPAGAAAVRPTFELAGFLARSAVKVGFRPARLPASGSSFVVFVKPLVKELVGAATLRLEGSDIEPVSLAFEPSGDEWTAHLSSPFALPGREPADSYSCTVELGDGDGRMIARRRFRLSPAVPLTRPAADRPARPAAGGGEPKNALAGLAAQVKIKRDADGKAVIDNAAVPASSGSSGASVGGTGDYSRLVCEGDRALARRIDALHQAYLDAVEANREASAGGSQSAAAVDPAYARRLVDETTRSFTEWDALRKVADAAGMRADSDGVWGYRSEPSCVSDRIPK